MDTLATNPLADVMSDEELIAKRDAVDSEAVKTLINGILQTREKMRADKELEEHFLQELNAKELPPPPSTIVNVYRAWRKVFRPLTKAERKDYLKTHPEATTEELDSKRIETDDWAWGQWELNKGFSPSGKTPAGNTTKPQSTKRAITVKRIEGDSLVFVGNFRNGEEACKYLKYETGGDSATRVLGRFGCVTTSYDGTDFTIKG